MLQLSILGIPGLALLNKGYVMNNVYDVAIIGGGPAGLTAALALGRIGRSVIIFDENKGRNFPAHHMMNFPSRDGTPPREFKEQIIKDLRKYSEITFRQEKVNVIRKNDGQFTINNHFEAKKILLAHGIKDILPEIPGIKELWGKAVFHCPYCHGHEFKRQKLGVMESDPKYLFHMAPLLLSLSGDVTIFTNGSRLELPPLLLEKVKVITAQVKKLNYYGEQLISLETETGEVKLDGLVIKPPQELTTDMGIKLGCELQENGLYKTDGEGQTSVPGVYAAGDIVDQRQAVILSCASGMRAAASISFSLVTNFLHP